MQPQATAQQPALPLGATTAPHTQQPHQRATAGTSQRQSSSRRQPKCAGFVPPRRQMVGYILGYVRLVSMHARTLRHAVAVISFFWRQRVTHSSRPCHCRSPLEKLYLTRHVLCARSASHNTPCCLPFQQHQQQHGSRVAAVLGQWWWLICWLCFDGQQACLFVHTGIDGWPACVSCQSLESACIQALQLTQTAAAAAAASLPCSSSWLSWAVHLSVGGRG